MKITRFHVILLLIVFIVGCAMLWAISKHTSVENFTVQKHVRHLYTRTIPRGMGDFIRGSIVLAKLCKERGVSFDIDYSMHPIHNYMINSKKNAAFETNMSAVRTLEDKVHTIQEMNAELDKELANKDLVFFGAVNPHIVYPIDDDIRAFVRDSFLPTDEIKNAVDETVIKLLGEKKPYAIVHARMGDHILVDKHTENSSKYDTIREKIKSQLHNVKDMPILVLSDDPNFKTYLHEKDGYFAVPTQPLHTMKDGDVKDTMVDFFLLCGASAIIQYSTYEWGSGFSDRAIDLYNIPKYKA